MDSKKKYMKSMNTVGYLSISGKNPIYKKTPTKYVPINNIYTNNYANNEMDSIPFNNGYNLLSKVMSKNKYKGILDITSHGNKDVFIDSDSERSNIKITEKLEKNNLKMPKKNGCAKLVIEKIESQLPTENSEYYKFTNKMKPSEKMIKTIFSKKTFVDKNSIRNNSSLKENSKTDQRYNKDYNFLSQSKQIFPKYKQPYQLYKEYVYYDSSPKKYQNASSNNIFRNISNNYLYKSSNNFYKPGYSVKTQTGFNRIGLNKDLSMISKSPIYIRTLNENTQRDNSSNNLRNNNLYETDSNVFFTYNQESTMPKNETKIFYLYNDNDNNNFNNIRYYRNKNETQQKHTLYRNYKNLIKMNNFNKLSRNNISYSKLINSYPGYKEKLIKLQSFWRGVYVRELMDFYWKITSFKDKINNVFQNYIYDYFMDFIDKLKNIQKNEKKNITTGRISINQRLNALNNKKKNINKEQESKNLEDFKSLLRQKEEDYDNLLKNYNSLVERCTELQQIINQNNENKKNENKNIVLEELSLDINNNNENKNINFNLQKKFDILEPEQKDIFNIIQKNIENAINKESDNTNIKLTSNNNYQDYLEHFKSNLNKVNIEKFLIEKKSKDILKNPLEISNYELSLIYNKTKKKISNEKKVINEICHIEPINIEKINNLEKNNNINIIENKKEFDQNLLSPNNNININIIKEAPLVIKAEVKNKDNINKETIDQFMIEKKNKDIISNEQEKSNMEIKKYQERNIVICENERFSLIKVSAPSDISKDKDYKDEEVKNKNIDLVVEKKDDILLIETNKNKDKKYDIELIIVNSDSLFIKRLKKLKCDKITEITEELNRIEPNNHYELIFEGRINLNEDITNKNKVVAENKDDNIIDKNKQELAFIQNEKVKLSNINNNINSNTNDINKNVNYNLNNEIEKGYGLEINPFEIKRSKGNNIFISHENKLEVLYNKYSIFTEKAKKNMMKIILPIRLKTTLREFIHRSIFPILINNLKKIAFASHLNKVDNDINKDSKKDAIDKIKNNVKSKFYKEYYDSQMKKKEIKQLLDQYAILKWNTLLYELCKELLSNKDTILEKLKK